ncbi:hypothetical protein [Chitinivibrio alkaliphilus]|nr:hypothetical protein [Chitinivibrio alkaliphilus]
MNKKCFLLMCVCAVAALSFEVHMDIPPREVLLRRMDSLEISIQRKRRQGESVYDTQREMERVRWALDQYISQSLRAEEETADTESSGNSAGRRILLFLRRQVLWIF